MHACASTTQGGGSAGTRTHADGADLSSPRAKIEAYTPTSECKPPGFEWAPDPYHAGDTPQHTITPRVLGLTPRVLGIGPRVVGVAPTGVGIGLSIGSQGACIREWGVGMLGIQRC